jgi:uncharacterized protein
MKATTLRIATLCLAAGVLCVSSCSLLAPQPDESHFFMLAPLPRTAAQPDASAPGRFADTILGLGPIKLPAYIDRNEMAIRLAPTQVTYSPVDRWAEPLNVNIGRVLLQNLSLLLRTDRIALYPWMNVANVQYQIEIEIMKFDATKAGETELKARYGIFKGGMRTLLAVREVSFSRTGAADTPAAVVAMSAVLGDLSEDIASALRQLPVPQEVPPATRKKS